MKTFPATAIVMTLAGMASYAACSHGSPSTVDPAILVIRASPSTLPGLTGLQLHYQAIEILQSETPDGAPTVVDLGAAPGTLDLVAFPQILPDYVGRFPVNPGYLSQIRFIVQPGDSLEGRIGSTVVIGKFPSGSETGLKARPSSGAPLHLENHTVVEVTVQFDAIESVRLRPDPTGNSPGLIVHPETTFVPGTVRPDNYDHVIPDELAVTFRDTAVFCDTHNNCVAEPVTRSRVDEFNATIGAIVLSSIPGSQTYLVRLPAGMSLDDGKAAYRSSGLVRDGDSGVGRNYLADIGAVPNDPFFPFQWYLNNTGQTGGLPGADISAPWAWNATVGSTAVRVAIVDTCFDTLHPDLHLAGGFNVGDSNFNVGCSGVTDPRYLVHGTAVAGVVGAIGNNGVGVAGVNWRVTVIPIRLTRSSDGIITPLLHFKWVV